MARASLPATLAGLVGLALAAAAQEGDGSARSALSPERAERALLVVGGRILVLDEEGSEAEALLAVDGRVRAIGREQEVRARAAGLTPTVLDLGGGVAIPALQDAHVRLGAYGGGPGALDLRDAQDFDEVVARVAAAAADVPRGRWVLGWGLSPRLWSSLSEIDHAPLSKAVPRHPVALATADGRGMFVNAEVLERTGLDGAVHDGMRMGSALPVDASGHVRGLLLDGAAERVWTQLPELELADRETRLLAAQEELLARGIGGVHDMGTSFEDWTTLVELRRKGLLRLRVTAYLRLDFAAAERRLDALRVASDPRGLLELGGVHAVIDGGLEWRGAALSQDYDDSAGQRGYLVAKPLGLTDMLRAAAQRGLQVSLDAQGDRAVRMALDSLESVGYVTPRLLDLHPRLETLRLVSLRDWKRFPELGVLPGMLPTEVLSDLEQSERALGEDRSAAARAWWVLAPNVGSLAYGSGFPARAPDPLVGVAAARRLLDWAFEAGGARATSEAALAGFTRGAALAANRGELRGWLVPGAVADLSVLDVDPLTATPDELERGRVLLTVVDGEVVWRAADR